MKKRILSLILALSMVLSVLPLGAFAAGSTQDLVIGSDGYPVGSEGGSKYCSGNGNGNVWEYYDSNRILCLNGGTFDLSTTEPVECKISSAATITGGTFNGAVENIDGTISGGIFNGTVTNASTGKISGGTFAGSVANGGTIENGTFEGQVTNDSNGEISGGTFQSTGSVTNEGTITGNGTFNGTVTNSRYIENGTFNGTVTNSRYIKNGTFNGTVTNNDAIFGGIFAGSVNNSDGCYIYGGVFNGNKNPTGITGHLSITVASGAKITEVNGVSADWKPYVVVTSFTETREVIITADTEIFSLNGYPIDGSPYSSSYPDTTDKKTVKFTELGVLDDEMVLNGAITHGGDLVMENGYPKASIGGKYSCEGKGWTYSEKDISNLTGKLTLKSNSGTYDFSLANPQDTTKTTLADSDVACKIEIQSGAKINGGTFNGTVTNNGTIERGTFAGGVTNSGTITNGTFACSVTNYSNIESKGTFNGTVENYGGTISSGTFKGTVQNWYGTISGGTFHEKVLNSNGEITGGTFAAGLSANHNTVTGGVFNGKTGLTDALHVTVTNGSVDKVNGVVTTGTAWDLYSYAGTTVIVTASTEIFSLNDQPIGGGIYNSSYGSDKKTVTFTMPDKDVVLNGAITCTELVMEKGRPEASNGGTISCSGTGWEYIKKSSGSTNTGTLYLMSGSEPFDFNFADPTTKITRTDAAVKCAIESYATISGGIFDGTVTNNAGGEISDGTFKGDVENSGYIEKGTFNGEVTNNTSGTIFGGTFRGQVDNNGKITGGIFAAGLSTPPGTVTGGIFNGNTGLTGAHHVTVTDGSVSTVNDEGPRNADGTWDLYSYAGTTVTIIADTDIFSLNGQPIGTGNCNSSYGSDKKTVTFTMPDDDVVLNGAITSTDLVMENGWPKDSDGGKNPCKGDGWQYIPNDPTYGNMLLLTGSNQTGGLFDFSTIGDGSAVECNVFVGKPTAITGGEFNGKVFNNSGILGGTFNGEVDNMGPGRIENGTFHGAVENNGIIENGTFNDAVKNNGTIDGGVFNGAVTGSGTVSESITGSGTLNGEPITKPEPTPEPEPTTYTVTVIGGTIDGKTSVSAKENDTLTVVLDQNDIPDGMTFDLWSISSSKLSGDINVDYRAEAMTFQMPAEDVTIRAQYRSAEIIEDAAPSPLATAATIAVGGAAAGIVVWQGVSLGVDLYLANALPQGVPVPTDRRALALLLWETAGKPEVALPTLYGDIPTEEIELQKATRWAVQNGLMDAADKKDASFFDPDHYVTKMDVFGAWLRLKKLLGTT